MDDNKITKPMQEEKASQSPQDSDSEKEKELSLSDLEKVTGGSMRDTIRTETEDITDNIKKRI